MDRNVFLFARDLFSMNCFTHFRHCRVRPNCVFFRKITLHYQKDCHRCCVAISRRVLVTKTHAVSPHKPCLLTRSLCLLPALLHDTHTKTDQKATILERPRSDDIPVPDLLIGISESQATRHFFDRLHDTTFSVTRLAIEHRQTKILSGASGRWLQ